MSSQKKALAEKPESIIKQVGVEGVYQKLVQHFGEEEVGLAKLTCAPSLSDKEFVHAMWLASQNGLNPLKRECFFYMAKNKKTGLKDLVFIIAIQAFRTRAQKNGMTMLQARAVCENDDFEWDHVKGQPLRHVSAKRDRGKVVSGWGRIKIRGMEEPTAVFKDAGEWLNPNDGFFHAQMGQHMMEITIERQMISMVCPDVFPGAYVPEEFGGRVVDGQLSMDPRRTAEPDKEAEDITPLTKDERALLINDIRGFFTRLGLERNAARWAKLEEIIGRTPPSKDPNSLADWELRRCHSSLKKDLEEASDQKTQETSKPMEVLEPELVTEEPKAEEKKDPCLTCGNEIEQWWSLQLEKHKATKRECQNCFWNGEGAPQQVQSET